MFSTNSGKICCSFAQNKIFEKSKMAAKMADMLWKRLLKFDILSTAVWKIYGGGGGPNDPPPPWVNLSQ